MVHSCGGRLGGNLLGDRCDLGVDWDGEWIVNLFPVPIPYMSGRGAVST